VTTYVDSSALLKCYIEEYDSVIAHELLSTDPVLVTSWITLVEVRRNIARLVDPTEATLVREEFEVDCDNFAFISCTETITNVASTIAETLGVRSLDAIHLASAQQLLISGLRFITFDIRQAQAARSLGMTVYGA
jgi:uncharacterized protein